MTGRILVRGSSGSPPHCPRAQAGGGGWLLPHDQARPPVCAPRPPRSRGPRRAAGVVHPRSSDEPAVPRRARRRASRRRGRLGVQCARRAQHLGGGAARVPGEGGHELRGGRRSGAHRPALGARWSRDRVRAGRRAERQGRIPEPAQPRQRRRAGGADRGGDRRGPPKPERGAPPRRAAPGRPRGGLAPPPRGAVPAPPRPGGRGRGRGAGRRVWTADTGRGSVFGEIVAQNQIVWGGADRLVFPWEKDGWTHLYAVPVSGGRATPLTPGAFEVEHVVVSPDGATVVFSSNQDDIERRHSWKVAVTGGPPVSLTRGTDLEWTPVVTADGQAGAFIPAGARTPPRALLGGVSGGAPPERF